ncbi:MAG: hypothetical protein IKU34_10245 [Clostridia bacterium]|nr:hypothetical protein [Clostridia bacterium]
MKEGGEKQTKCQETSPILLTKEINGVEYKAVDLQRKGVATMMKKYFFYFYYFIKGCPLSVNADG